MIPADSGSAAFWGAIAAEGLRGDREPSWPRANLRSPVSLGCLQVPGAPGHRPCRDDHPDTPETAK